MLLEAPYKMNDTVTIKTAAGGDEIVCRFVEEDNTTITITKPMALMSTPEGIGLGPYTFTVDPKSNIKINKSAVVFCHKTEDNMAKQYVQSTTGIALA
jgi:hypothetical protein